MKTSLLCSFNAKVRMQNRIVDMLVTMCVGGCVGEGGVMVSGIASSPKTTIVTW